MAGFGGSHTYVAIPQKVGIPSLILKGEKYVNAFFDSRHPNIVPKWGDRHFGQEDIIIHCRNVNEETIINYIRNKRKMIKAEIQADAVRAADNGGHQYQW